MKITFLVAMADLSGGARVVSIYARALADRGHAVTVVIARGAKPGWRERSKRLVTRARPRGPSPSHFDAMDDITNRLNRLGPIRSSDCPDADVVVATWWETAEWMNAMPAEKGRKTHFVQHYEAFDYTPTDRVDAVLRSDSRKIAISSWLYDLLTKTFGNTDVYFVPNGVDMAQFHAVPRRRAAAPTVGILYHSAPFKNCRAAISAFERLRTRYPGARLVAFGVEAINEDNPLPADTVYHRLPAQDDIRNIYAACDVWLCTSLSEGFFLPLLEAMACRCPVISTPVGGPRDIINEGRNGFLIPFDDVEGTAKALIDFFELDAEQWRQLSDEALRTAEKYSWLRAVNQFEQALQAQ